MHSFLIWAVIIYFIIGLSITGFCVHMSYHEAAVGFGDSHDAKAQKVLESRIGPLGFVFLFTFWPVALLIAFLGAAKSMPAEGSEHAAAPHAIPETAAVAAAPVAQK